RAPGGVDFVDRDADGLQHGAAIRPAHARDRVKRPDSKRFARRLGPGGPRKHRGGPQGHTGRHELAAAAVDAVLHIRSFCAVCALRFFEYAGLDCPAPCCSCCRPLLTTLGLAAWPATRSCAAGRTACFSRSEEHTSELQSRENLVCP